MTELVHRKLEEMSCVARQLMPSRMRMRLSSRRQEVGNIRIRLSRVAYEARVAPARATLLPEVDAHVIALRPSASRTSSEEPTLAMRGSWISTR